MATSQELNFVRLKSFAATLAERWTCSADVVLDPIGLNLHEELGNIDYFCTPLNTVTFASTGGDGVHFGLLSEEDSSAAPVVMTVPCADSNAKKCNLVLGESLFEFLCLGVNRGFFSLEQLAYDREKTIKLYSSRLFLKDEYDAQEQELLNALKTEFGLQPWPEIDGRLRELERQYLPKLDFPDFDEWCRRNGVGEIKL